jgi:serine O-acetyltransferase
MQDLALKLFQRKSDKTLPFTLSQDLVEAFCSDSLDLFFPGMARKFFLNQKDLEDTLSTHQFDLLRILKIVESSQRAESLTKLYLNELLTLTNKIELDARAMFEGDPAAKNLSEVLICYPGLFAIAVYRLAHFFYEQKVDLLARILSEIAHAKTGIDIHPGAKIGDSFFIDHGTGIVIGESAVIGKGVKLYQGVTLGALSVDKSMAKIKRHPTIEDHCVVYSHATILGGDTVIGAHSVIGGNVWMTKSVAPYSVVYHKSEVRLDTNKKTDFINQQEELTYEI